MSLATYDAIECAAARHSLAIMGGVYEAGNTILLLGPTPAFWPLFKRSPEWLDGARHPIDRWSHRIISALAEQLGAKALFPFGGPPYQPFLRWAIASGRAWQSPAGMLVHDVTGLMISYRGALCFSQILPLPPTGPSPCETCIEKPCITACPVNALSAEKGYDTAACHAFLDTLPGEDCLARGCKARRACPVSQRFGRAPEQSAHHMRYFHPR